MGGKWVGGGLVGAEAGDAEKCAKILKIARRKCIPYDILR